MKDPRVPEKVVQQQIREALIKVGAKVYTIGRPPRRDAVHKGTGQTPGIPDLLVFLPESPRLVPSPLDRWPDGSPVMVATPTHMLWIEVKAKGGKLREEQAEFQARCRRAGVDHLVGGLDAVLAYLVEHGYVSEVAHYRRRSA